MTTRALPIAMALVIVAGMLSPASAGVVVLTNRTESKVAFTLVQPDNQRTRHELDPGEVIPASVATTVIIIFDEGNKPCRRTLQANAIYYFDIDGNKLDLFEHTFGGLSKSRPTSAPSRRDSVCTIPVKIVVDDKEPTVQRLWEKRYRQRMAEASEIIERHCRVRFEVVAVGVWTSDDNAHDLQGLFEDFQRKVKPAPARLVVGFTGQFQTLQKDTHMGGTPGALRSHVLIREWGQQIAESERLEILVHELGHFLGAAHSSEAKSVMRPDLSDRYSRARAFRIGFDAPNTLAMYLIGEELCSRPLTHLGQLPSTTKDELRAVYASLVAALPNDPAAPQYLAMLGPPRSLTGPAPEHLQTVIAGARSVVRAVVEAAQKNHRLPDAHSVVAGDKVRCEGDELTEYYVRQAAAAAQRLPRDIATRAFLLGLGVALDDSSLTPKTPIVGGIWQQVESAPERTARLAVLGTPTMHARHDLVQHFAVSAALVVLVGPQGAEGAGILKEMADSRDGSGFSFVDLSADLAGIALASAIGEGNIPLSRLENGFVVRDFLPDGSELSEGIVWDDFVNSYGNPPDARLARERDRIRKRILALSGYKHQ